MKIPLKSKEMLETVTDFFQNIYYSVRRFFTSIKRSYDFAKIGWSNYDYDYAYLFELMRFKLERMEKQILNGYAEPNKRTNQSIRICIKLLKKMAFKDYGYFTGLHYAKWGEPEFISSNDSDSKGLYRLTIEHKNAVTEEEKEQQKKEFKEAYAKDQKQEERDIRLLFAIMAKYHRRWWD